MFGLVLDWEAFKVWLSAASGLSHHDWHLLLGVLLTLAFGVLLRRPLGSLLPLGLVLALELVNEASDFIRYHVDHYPWGPGPMLVDIAITVLPPLAIVLAARWDGPAFHRFRRRPAVPGEGAGEGPAFLLESTNSNTAAPTGPREVPGRMPNPRAFE